MNQIWEKKIIFLLQNLVGNFGPIWTNLAYFGHILANFQLFYENTSFFGSLFILKLIFVISIISIPLLVWPGKLAYVNIILMKFYLWLWNALQLLEIYFWYGAVMNLLWVGCEELSKMFDKNLCNFCRKIFQWNWLIFFKQLRHKNNPPPAIF